jgi:phospholipid/cholesterol/gamma-HCH transport system substrate-binding protein
MDERVVKFRVGVMVISTLFIAGILVLLFGDARSIVRGSYSIFIHFEDAPGVTDGTPVRKSGILIGRVTSVSFSKRGGVNVEAKIDGSVKLYHDEVPQVTGSLLGGDVVIQFVRRARPPADPYVPPEGNSPGKVIRPEDASETRTGGPNPAAQAAAQPPDSREVQPGELIEGSVAPNAFQVFSNMEGQMATAVEALGNAGTEVGKVAANINKVLESNDDQINRIVSNTDESLKVFRRVLENVDDVIGDSDVRDNVKSMLRDLPELMADTRETVTTMKTTMDSVDRNLRNLEGFTGPLGERGETIIDNIDRALAQLDTMMGEFSDFGRKLNSGEGSLGMLIRDKELYMHLNGAATNIEKLTRELKPILADVRVFSDKIARHPESLGVRGAIQRNPGIK